MTGVPVKIGCCALGLFLGLVGTLWSAQLNKAEDPKRILLLSSYRNDLPGLANMEENIRATIREGWKGPVEFYHEHMERSRFAGKDHEKSLIDLYRQRYSTRNLDLVIPIQLPALDFVLEHGEDLLGNNPVVFAHVLESSINGKSLPPNMTGVTMGVDFERLLHTILRTQPDTRRVVFVGGTAPTDQGYEKRARQSFHAHADTNRIEFVYLTDLSMGELLNRITNLPAKTAVIVSSVHRDAFGQSFVPLEVVKQVAEASNVPTYAFVSVGLGQGVVGGYMNSHGLVGKRTGEVALRVLRGENPSDIPVSSQGTNAPMFDARQLRRWGIPKASLPAESVVRYDERTIWEEYGNYISGVLAVLVFQAALIGGLVVARERRKKMQQALAERLEFEQLLLDLSRDFADAKTSEIAGMIEPALGNVGRVLRVDRVVLLEFDEDRKHLEVTCIWKDKNVPLDPEILSFDVRERFPWLTDKILRDEPMVIHNLDDFPPEARNERAYSESMGLRSSLIVPYKVEGRVLGTLALDTVRDERHWSAEVLPRLRLLGDIFNSALVRKRVDEKQQQLREQLTHVSRVATLGEMAGSLAHELRQPLTAILSNAQAAQRFLAHESVDLEEVRAAIEDIVADDRRASGVLKSLRRFFKREQAAFQIIDVNRLVTEVLDLVRGESAEKQTSIKNTLARDLPPVPGDAIQLQQVMLNLIHNGFDAIAAAANGTKELTIRTSLDAQGQIELSISDSGAGLSAEAANQLFDPFFTTKKEGLGLGLAISRSIIEAHAGRIWATSNAGGGTTFHITLPAASPTRETDQIH